MSDENKSNEKIIDSISEHDSSDINNFDDFLGDSPNITNNSVHRESMKSSVVDILISKNLDPKNKNFKNLYQNIGTRVSKLRELNDSYINKLNSQKGELYVYEERLQEKLKLLEQLRQARLKNDKKFFNEKYKELLAKNTIDLKIHSNHVLHDADLKKLHEDNEQDISNLKNKLNGLLSNSKDIKDKINLYRIENNKLEISLSNIMRRKEERAKKMDLISKEANNYLKEKDVVNKKILELNTKIEELKETHENKVFEIKQMIDDSKRIKQLQENFAFEKFAINNNNNNVNFRPNNSSITAKANNSESNTSINKINEEQIKLDNLNSDFKKKKRMNVYLNFSKMIIWKKQQNLHDMIEKVKRETGCENLDKLSEYLAISTKSNKLFETDLEKLNQDKKAIEDKISDLKLKIESCKCELNDTSSQKFQHMEKLKTEIVKENKLKDIMNRKLYNMNRIVDLLAIGLKNICTKINHFEGNLASYGVVNNFIRIGLILYLI